MRKILFLSAISIASLGYSQTNCESIKKENETLQSTIRANAFKNFVNSNEISTLAR
jgi:hypothetical protein